MNSTLQECVMPELVQLANESEASFDLRKSYLNETQPWCFKTYWNKPKTPDEIGTGTWTGDVTNRGCSFARQDYPLPVPEGDTLPHPYEHETYIEFWHSKATYYSTNYCKEDGCNGYAQLYAQSIAVITGQSK